MSKSKGLELLRATAPTVSIGVVTANLLSLGSEIELLERVGAKLAHVDVMDGCFCPMMTVGPPFIKAIKTSLLKDAHLMIQDPLEKMADYVAAGADMITIHPESCSQPHRVLQKLGQLTNVNDGERGIVRGIALNPSTPLEVLRSTDGRNRNDFADRHQPRLGRAEIHPRHERSHRARATHDRGVRQGHHSVR